MFLISAQKHRLWVLFITAYDKLLPIFTSVEILKKKKCYKSVIFTLLPFVVKLGNQINS